MSGAGDPTAAFGVPKVRGRGKCRSRAMHMTAAARGLEQFPAVIEGVNDGEW